MQRPDYARFDQRFVAENLPSGMVIKNPNQYTVAQARQLLDLIRTERPRKRLKFAHKVSE